MFMVTFKRMMPLLIILIGMLIHLTDGAFALIVNNNNAFSPIDPKIVPQTEVLVIESTQPTEIGEGKRLAPKHPVKTANGKDMVLLEKSKLISDGDDSNDENRKKEKKSKRKSKKEKKSKKKKKSTKSDDLPVYGFIEKVIISPKKLKFKAKLDSGAGTSSLSAHDLVEFERDGKKWVRFYMTDPKTNKKIKFEKKVRRYVKIKEHKGESQRRPVVLMDAKLGETYAEKEFTLADRGNFIYPVLLGRNFIRGVALIDVSRAFLAKTRSSDRNK